MTGAGMEQILQYVDRAAGESWGLLTQAVPVCSEGLVLSHTLFFCSSQHPRRVEIVLPI